MHSIFPQDFTMFEPTEADYASVSEAIKWMKRYVDARLRRAGRV